MIQITIKGGVQVVVSNGRVLRWAGFYPLIPGCPMRVEQPLLLWVRCLWWTLRRRLRGNP